MTLSTQIRGATVFGAAAAVLVAGVWFLPLSSAQTGLAFRVLLFIGLAVSWNIIGGIAGQLHLGHAAFFGVGAYAAATLMQGSPSVVGLLSPLSAVVLALASGLLVVPLIIPCFRAGGAYFAILTLAYVTVAQQLAQRYAPGQNSGIFSASFPIGSRLPLAMALVAVFIALWSAWAILHSRIGMGLVAVKADIEAARAVGVSDLKVRTWAMGVSGALGGVFGGLYALNLGYVDPTTAFSLEWSIFPLLAAMLGGMGTLTGPVIGAIIWSVLDEFMGRIDVGGAIAFMIEGGILLGMALAAPQGIVGIWRRIRRRPASSALPTKGSGAASRSPHESTEISREARDSAAVTSNE